VFHHDRLERLADRTIAGLQRSLAREPEAGLRRGMAFPVSWDPYFERFMALSDVYRFPVRHFEHHRRQLTLGDPARRPGEAAAPAPGIGAAG
jgi:hypothetical protein